MHTFKVFIAAVFVLAIAPAVFAQAPKPTPDVLVFANGDQLTGKLLRAGGGNIVFKSDMAGELTIGFDKIKELRSGNAANQFALLKKGAPMTKAIAPEGTVSVEAGKVTLTPATGSGAPLTVAAGDVNLLIDKPAYDKAVQHKDGFFRDWTGNVSGGATVVRSTTTGTTLSTALNLLRVESTVPWLPVRNKTILNVAESYGTLSTPAIPPTVPATPATVVKTSVFHAGAERDEYINPRLFALVSGSFDHNYSQGLQFQQVYGGGLGYTPYKTDRQELDVKAQVQYEMQSFVQTAGSANTPNVNIIGSTFGETYVLKLPYKTVFNELGTFLPAWNNSSDYSANVTATLTLPVFKRLSASITSTDGYLNNPPPYYNKNSYQFITGITYSLR